LNTDTAGTNAINSSCISGNTASNIGGVRSTASTLDATFNWWGAANGPSGAGSGSGDQVSSKVNFASYEQTTTCELSAGASGQALTSVETASIDGGTASLNLNQFLNTQQPVRLPYVPEMEDETVWQISGTWDLSRFAGRSTWTWVVDAVPRQQESILEFIFPLDLGNRPGAQLSFEQRIQLAGTDTFTIEVLPQNATQWLVVDSQTAASSDWQLHTVDLSAYRGQIIRLRARLLTGDELARGEISTAVWLDSFLLDYGGR